MRYYKITNKKTSINPVFDDFGVFSPKQIILSVYMRNYRYRHNISQKQMAEICSLHGKPRNISFTVMEISNYERYKTIPTPAKFQVLMNTMDIDPSML